MPLARQRRWLEDLEGRLMRSSPADDERWYPWGEGAEAWADVSPDVKAELRRQYALAGGRAEPVMVYRAAEGWRLGVFNLPLGRASYLLARAAEDLGPDALMAWAETEATEEEVEVLIRVAEHGWDPASLQPGDTAVLLGLGERLTRVCAPRPGLPGGVP